jgi:phage terminase large subunit GpA-like protein
VADTIDQDPGPCLYVLPDENSGRKHLEEKLISVIKESPELAVHLTGKLRDMSKTGIRLDNMTLYPAWAGSLASMSSFPMKRVFLDEVRLMPLTTGNESNAIKLASDRLTTYHHMGIGQGYLVSSPSVEGDLLHQQMSVPGTVVLRWQVPCMSCGRYQQLNFFKNVKNGICECIHCKSPFIDSDQKVVWNRRGIYAPEDTEVYRDGTLEKPYCISSRMIYRWSSLESPFRSFSHIWKEYLETKDKLHDYKNFIQCWLAEFWIDDISRTSVLSLRERIGTHELLTVDRDALVLTTGIDTQDDGFYVVTRAHGSGKRSWLVDHYFVRSRVDTMSTEELATLFEKEVMSRVYVGESGERWMTSAVAIDSGGHRTNEIYALSGKFSKLFLIKGRNEQSQRVMNAQVPGLYLVRTCEYLEETEIRATTDSSWKLPVNVSEDYLTQFCNVRKVKKQNKRTGEEKIEWKKVGQCDYRFADVHSYICLDIETDRGVFRNEIERTHFKLNPCAVAPKQVLHTAPVEYSVSDFNW